MTTTKCWYDRRYNCRQPEKHLLDRTCYTCEVGIKKNVKETRLPTLKEIDKLMKPYRKNQSKIQTFSSPESPNDPIRKLWERKNAKP